MRGADDAPRRGTKRNVEDFRGPVDGLAMVLLLLPPLPEGPAWDSEGESCEDENPLAIKFVVEEAFVRAGVASERVTSESFASFCVM